MTLDLRGRVLSADPTPAPLDAATVALMELGGPRGWPTVRFQTTTDRAGTYRLTYTFPSRCQPQDQTSYWLDASADGYETASTFVQPDYSTGAPEYSHPPIYCTEEAQEINLSLRPLGWLRLITSTSGSAPDPDGYTLSVDDTLAYTLGVNGALVLAALPGRHALELTGVAANCSLAGANPRSVTATARDTTASTFEVACAP